MENLLEEYWLFMKREISSLENSFESDKLLEEHAKQVVILTEGSSGEKLEDATGLLNSHLFNFIECQQALHWQNNHHDKTDGDDANNNYVCFYVTHFWLFLMTHSNSSEMQFHPSPEEPRFNAQVGRSSKTGKLVSGHNFHRLADAEKMQVENYEYFLDHVNNAAINDSRVSREITRDFMKSVQFFSTAKKCSTQKIVLVVPSVLAFEETSLLRECCKAAGFTKAVMLSDSSLATYRLYSTLPPCHQVAVLVVNIFGNYTIQMEVFGCDRVDGEGDIKAVKLLAKVVQEEWNFDKSIFSQMYNRALAQLSKQRQNSMWYYTVISEYPNLADICLEQFLRFGENLRKISVVRDHKLLEIVAHLVKCPGKLANFCNVMTTNSLLPVEAQENNEQVDQVEYDRKDIKRESIVFKNAMLPPVSAKLPLNIDTQDGKIYCIPACTDWTVRSLKESFKDLLGSHNHGPFLLQYGTQKLHHDNYFLSAYNMQPDSVIQANFYLAVKKPVKIEQNEENVKPDDDDEISIARKNVIQLIGYCVARKYGMEREDVEGIKRGSVIVAQISSADTNNAASGIGDVKKTCRINGLNGVYVKVEFKNQLHLRSSGIRIEHVNSTGGNCVKCNKPDKIEMCIRRDLIGDSSRHLFRIR